MVTNVGMDGLPNIDVLIVAPRTATTMPLFYLCNNVSTSCFSISVTMVRLLTESITDRVSPAGHHINTPGVATRTTHTTQTRTLNLLFSSLPACAARVDCTPMDRNDAQRHWPNAMPTRLRMGQSRRLDGWTAKKMSRVLVLSVFSLQWTMPPCSASHLFGAHWPSHGRLMPWFGWSV